MEEVLVVVVDVLEEAGSKSEAELVGVLEDDVDDCILSTPTWDA